MIVNGLALLDAAPIKNMFKTKERNHGVSHGLAEAGYDIRLKQEVTFIPNSIAGRPRILVLNESKLERSYGRFTKASSMEEFQVPNDLVGVVHDKSTWARHGLSVFNTVLEPGWKGFLTLELVYHGEDYFTLPAGCGIAQVLFSRIELDGSYTGKYQNQPDAIVEAIMEK